MSQLAYVVEKCKSFSSEVDCNGHYTIDLELESKGNEETENVSFCGSTLECVVKQACTFVQDRENEERSRDFLKRKERLEKIAPIVFDCSKVSLESDPPQDFFFGTMKWNGIVKTGQASTSSQLYRDLFAKLEDQVFCDALSHCAAIWHDVP